MNELEGVWSGNKSRGTLTANLPTGRSKIAPGLRVNEFIHEPLIIFN